MPKMIPLAAIGVTRKGVTVYPPVGTDKDGEPFDFTADEISQIQAMEKANDVQMLRKLRNEGSDDSGTAALDNHGQNGQGSVELTKNTQSAAPAAAPTAPKTFTVANSAAELKAEASARGLDFSTLKTKAELVALLDANPAKAEDAPSEEEADEDL